MDGLMQRTPLLVTSILDQAAKFHGDREIISRSVDDPDLVVKSSWAEVHQRSKSLALALRHLGVKAGDRVGTLAWNTIRHVECWYGIAGLGAVCHTINPRLFANDLAFIINHAESLVSQLKTVTHFIVLTDPSHMPKEDSPCSLPNLLCYDTLVESQAANAPTFQWVQCDENQGCGLCYTSGTTGHPKGVVYTHRANYLHAMMACLPDCMNMKAADCVLMVVPMFHANSWGLCFSTPMVGAKLVLPAQYLTGPSIHSMMEEHKVTTTAGVPTVWLNLSSYMEENNLKLSTVKFMAVGGSALPQHIVEFFEYKLGIEMRQMWGMTELCPIGTFGTPNGSLVETLTKEEALQFKLKQGRPAPLLDLRIINDDGTPIPQDGTAFGDLQVRGPHTISSYYKPTSNENSTPCIDAEGWFSTGDVATWDRYGTIQIVDRTKDVIKSGGEWISSIEIENKAVGHPGVKEAAVIAKADEKWGERPLLFIVRAKGWGGGSAVTAEGILGYLKGKIASWWMPDEVRFIEEIPHTASGKISKLELRRMHGDAAFVEPK